MIFCLFKKRLMNIMGFEVNTYEYVTVVKPDCDIRIKSILALKGIFEKLEKMAVSVIAIDLSDVRFIDSSGIGLLINFAKKQQIVNRNLCLFNYTKDVMELIEMVGLGEILPVYEDFNTMNNSLIG